MQLPASPAGCSAEPAPPGSAAGGEQRVCVANGDDRRGSCLGCQAQRKGVWSGAARQAPRLTSAGAASTARGGAQRGRAQHAHLPRAPALCPAVPQGRWASPPPAPHPPHLHQGGMPALSARRMHASQARGTTGRPQHGRACGGQAPQASGAASSGTANQHAAAAPARAPGWCPKCGSSLTRASALPGGWPTRSW